jgi:hypothetical protein
MNSFQKTPIANVLLACLYVQATTRRLVQKIDQACSPKASGLNEGRWLAKALNTVGLIVILILGINMNAQAQLFGIGGKTKSWKEEVLLHDGQIIIAERFYNLGGYSTIDSTERAAVDQTVTFSLPGTNKKIVWKTNYNATDIKVDNLGLILFDVVNDTPYIATYPVGCFAFEKWKRPNPPYVLFKYESNQWKQISLSELPIPLNKANVVVGLPATVLLKPFYSVAQVNEKNRNVVPRYKAVLREPLMRELCPLEHSGPKAPDPIEPSLQKK